MSTDAAPSAQLAQLAALLEQLPAYLASNAMFRPVVVPEAGHQTVTLTLGTLLGGFERARAEAAAWGASDAARLAELDARFDALRTAQHAAYADKLIHELKSQLDSWRWYLDDCEKRSDGCGENYRDEVGKRTRIQQLLAEAAARGIPAEAARERVQALDAQLRKWFRSGAYNGAPGTDARYPQSTYWWLYGRPDR